MTEPEQPHHQTAGTWADVDQDSARFRSLLVKYHDDYQQATDAYLRGEEGDPKDRGGSANPM
jgi:hypothetical protein